MIWSTINYSYLIEFIVTEAAQNIPAFIQISVNEKLYLRNPQESALGKKIIGSCIRLIDQIGFEAFNFKKLAAEIQSTEASIYRYFRSKRHLLGYLFAWYWSWLQYRILLKTTNISDPKRRLETLIEVLAESVTNDPSVPHIDESVLHRIVVSESDRSLAAYQARSGGKEGGLEAYESLCRTITGYIRELKPKYEYPQALTLTLLATTHRQRFYATNFPNVTEVNIEDNNQRGLAKFLKLLVFSMLK